MKKIEEARKGCEECKNSLKEQLKEDNPKYYNNLKL